MLWYAYWHGYEWGPKVCSAAAKLGNLATLEWLRQNSCSWDYRTNAKAAVNGHLEVLKWARQQQPPCPFWFHEHIRLFLGCNIRPSVLVFLRQQHAPLSASHLAQARAAATKLTHAVLLLRALPDQIPHEIVMNIVSLALL